MVKSKLLLIVYVLIFLLSISFIYAPPVQKNEAGLSIRFPQSDVIKNGRNLELNTHVDRITDGLAMKSDINCTLHLYNSTGQHIINIWNNVISETFDIEFELDGRNFTTNGIY